MTTAMSIMRGVFDHAKESYLFRASATGAAGDGTWL